MEKIPIGIPLVGATERGTVQTESLAKAKGDVGLGPSLLLPNEAEMAWKGLP
jgi:hypothetical protein